MPPNVDINNFYSGVASLSYSKTSVVDIVMVTVTLAIVVIELNHGSRDSSRGVRSRKGKAERRSRK